MSCDVTWRLKWFCGYLDAADPLQPGLASTSCFISRTEPVSCGVKAAVSGGQADRQTRRTVKQALPATPEQLTHVNTFVLKPLVLQHPLKI